MVDEELGYRSLSFRNSLVRYQQSDEFSERDKGWGEITTSFLKRDGGTEPSIIPECQQILIGERSADIHYYMYL